MTAVARSRTQRPSGGRTSSNAGIPFVPCVTASYAGSCGPFTTALITQTNPYGHITVNNDVYDPETPTTQTLTCWTPNDWNVVANMPNGITHVISYPSIGLIYPVASNDFVPLPINQIASFVSSFTEDKGTVNAGTSVDIGYDMWMTLPSIVNNDPFGGWYAFEMMIQHDVVNRGIICPNPIRVTFGGQWVLGGVTVPQMDWYFCVYGSNSPYGPELVWSPVTLPGITSGSVDILAMIMWCVTNGYLPAEPLVALGALGYGFEICSTGGVNETFTVSNFSAVLTQGTLAVETSPALELSGFGTFPQISAGQVIDCVTVTVTEYQSDTKQSPCSFELWQYASPTPARVGTATGTAGTVGTNTSTAAFTGVTYDMLSSLRVRIYGNSLYSTLTESVDSVSVVVHYAETLPVPAGPPLSGFRS